MMALASVELETLVFEPDALTTRPPPCADFLTFKQRNKHYSCYSQIKKVLQLQLR